ncbi:integrase core domain-containing protein [Neisseria bacilliformis]|uniref:integrase core domain-containing protein n=1 Tax=Neisseria bacilliformis TaxID=267212 RepID=UPI0028EFBABE|nr:integrase core domain-containing protein [Neisseria bacilliformis]
MHLPFYDAKSASKVECQQTLGNNKLCYPLTVTDHFSRYLLMCQALSGTQRAPVTALFERLFTEFGLPWAIRSDNGAPFASTALGGISHLSKWWIDLGIRPERIQPAHPEQNGRHERMHRSLKDSLHARLDKMEQDLCAQQVVFDAFVREYNHERSHEGIGRKTPSECYTPSNRLYTGRIEPYDYGEGVALRQVKGGGEIKWKGKTLYLSQVLAHEAVAFVPYADGVWHIFYRFHFLGLFDEREGKIIPATHWHAKPSKP